MTARPTRKMPEDVYEALQVEGMEEDYHRRPHYQRNDYLGWIQQAKREETRRKRIAQMVAELRRGGVYMGMKHGPSAKR
jgi:uncharacterized protein YdeI (YjbR/CyaY-like superfamily)